MSEPETIDIKQHQRENNGQMPSTKLTNPHSSNYILPRGFKPRIPLRRKMHYNVSKFTKNWFTKKRTRGVVAYQDALLRPSV